MILIFLGVMTMIIGIKDIKKEKQEEIDYYNKHYPR